MRESLRSKTNYLSFTSGAATLCNENKPLVRR